MKTRAGRPLKLPAIQKMSREKTCVFPNKIVIVIAAIISTWNCLLWRPWHKYFLPLWIKFIRKLYKQEYRKKLRFPIVATEPPGFATRVLVLRRNLLLISFFFSVGYFRQWYHDTNWNLIPGFQLVGDTYLWLHYYYPKLAIIDLMVANF